MASYLFRKMDEKEYYLAMANRPKKRNTFSQYRGVVKATGNYLYRVQFKYKGVQYACGSFNDEIEAALAYNKMALHVIGPHAVLNDVSKGRTQREGRDNQGSETLNPCLEKTT